MYMTYTHLWTVSMIVFLQHKQQSIIWLVKFHLCSTVTAETILSNFVNLSCILKNPAQLGTLQECLRLTYDLLLSSYNLNCQIWALQDHKGSSLEKNYSLTYI